MEGIHIEALVLPDKTRLLHVLLQEVALGIVGGDDAVVLALRLELLSNFKHCSSFSRVLREIFSKDLAERVRNERAHMQAGLMFLLCGVFNMDKPAGRGFVGDRVERVGLELAIIDNFRDNIPNQGRHAV